MCIIVDANRLGDFLADPAKPDSAPIRKWLDHRGGRMVYSTGGAFAKEIGRRLRAKLRGYVQAGKANVVPAAQFAADERKLTVLKNRRFNDPHVLALARATGVRLLYTHDANLMADFRNKKLIDKPRGKIYSSVANSDLLARAACARVTNG